MVGGVDINASERVPRVEKEVMPLSCTLQQRYPRHATCWSQGITEVLGTLQLDPRQQKINTWG